MYVCFTDISQYRSVFLYSLCLLWDTEAPLDLPSDQLDVAISFYELMFRYASRHKEPSGARKNRGRSPDANSSFTGVDHILGAHDSDDDLSDDEQLRKKCREKINGEEVVPLPFDDMLWPLSPLSEEV